MTATPSVDRAASRLVAALEHAWTAIRRRHPDVPQVVIVVASSSDPRSRRLNLGHFAAGRWQLTDQPTDRAEVLVSGEGLHRGPVDVLGTLLPEAGRHSNPALLFQLPRRGTARYGNDPRARYCLGLDIYSNQPIPASGGPA
jgi:hypothetical protein